MIRKSPTRRRVGCIRRSTKIAGRRETRSPRLPGIWALSSNGLPGIFLAHLVHRHRIVPPEDEVQLLSCDLRLGVESEGNSIHCRAFHLLARLLSASDNPQGWHPEEPIMSLSVIIVEHRQVHGSPPESCAAIHLVYPNSRATLAMAGPPRSSLS